MPALHGPRRAPASADGAPWSFQPRLVEAAQAHDGGAAAAITRESLLSATARVEETLDAPAPSTAVDLTGPRGA